MKRVPSNALLLGAVVDDQAAHAGVADDQVRAAAEDEVGQPAAAREADEAAQLEQVVHLGEQVGRAAHAHRGEAAPAARGARS